MTREIIDLSLPITDGLPTWPGDVPVRLWRHSTPAQGAPNVSGLQLGTHAGTHLDAPCHWFEGGLTVDQIPLARLVGPARVTDLRAASANLAITPGRLAQAVGQTEAGERLLLLTGWRGTVAVGDYPHLSREAAEWLADRQPALVGIDTPSVDAPTAGGAHEVLLGAGIPLLESLVNLDRLVGHAFALLAAPLPVVGLDGAPVRAIALLPPPHGPRASSSHCR